MEIPLFPLHTVLVPGAPLPLHIFEPRYRALVTDCLAAGEPFGVVCISAGREVGAGLVSFAAAGTLAEIREVTRHPDGRFDIVTIGTARFRLTGVDATRKPYLVGTGEILPEPLGDPERVAHLAARVRSRFVRYLELLQQAGEDETVAEDEPPAEDQPPAGRGSRAGDADPEGDAAPEPPPEPPPATSARERLAEVAARLAPPGDPTTLGHVVSGLVQVELPRRQELLEAATTEERLAGLDALLAREVALLARSLAPYGPDPRLVPLRRN
jgi:Lon protease-like protein